MLTKKTNKIFVFIGSIILIMLSFAFGNIIKADTNPIEYNEYNYLINIYDIGVSQVDGQDVYAYNVVAEIRNNTFYYVDGDNNGYSFTSDYTITESGLYLVNATRGTTQSGYYYYYLIIQLAIRYEYYIASYDNYAYTIGYSDGRKNGLEDGYASGYTDGTEDGYASGTEDGYASGYTDGTEHGYDLGYDLGYDAGVNAQIPNQQFSILALLGTIFMFPFKLIALGFDVEIFGVNFGKLMIFILWTCLILGIVGLVKKGW